MGEVRVIEAASSADDDLVKECEEKTICNDCNPTIDWRDLSTNPTTTTPSKDTVVIIVDVRNSKGAFRIFDSDGRYLGGIGTDKAGKLMIVPWENGWYFRAAGSLPVGYVTRRVRDGEA